MQVYHDEKSQKLPTPETIQSWKQKTVQHVYNRSKIFKTDRKTISSSTASWTLEMKNSCLQYNNFMDIGYVSSSINLNDCFF
jgi:hypothetical protein